jgi:tetratricopeptide (TPR) repeat protein
MAPSVGNALSLIKAVLELVADRRTGLLAVSSEGLRTRIYFDDGKPVFAEDDALGETFGRLLMRQGVIANDQFVRVIDEMTRAAAGNSQLRFGEVAVSLGVLTPEQVERGLAEQVCGVITRALQRGASEWDVELSPAAAAPPRSFALAINPAVLAALRQSSDMSAVAGVVAARPEELVVVAGPRPAPQVEGAGTPAETHAARMAAEQAFQKGILLLREAKNASAAIELRRASELQPESLEYLLYATWARSRSYREVPTDSDQQALLDIAQRAKRRDPMFAFASFVIGQVSMWSGDDAKAKKWFYEALRLDPVSEASKQVRILARRGPAPAGGGEAPVHYELAAVPAHEPAAHEPVVHEPVAQPLTAHEAPAPAPPVPRPSMSPPPVPADAVAQAAKARSRRWAGRLAALGALAVTTLVIFAVARKSAPQAGLSPGLPSSAPPTAPSSAPPTASTEPALSAGLPAPIDPERVEAAAAPAPAPKPADEASERSAPEVETMGTVRLPARAAGHRVFVDGRRAKTPQDQQKDQQKDQQQKEGDADGVAPLRLRCGSHVVQIGSSGTPERIDIPCGGEVQIE